MNFTTTVEQYADTKDYYIQIPHYILQNLNWKEGDTLDWHITDSKQIIITKIKDGSSTEEEYKDFDECYDDYITEYIEEKNNKKTFLKEGRWV